MPRCVAVTLHPLATIAPLERRMTEGVVGIVTPFGSQASTLGLRPAERVAFGRTSESSLSSVAQPQLTVAPLDGQLRTELPRCGRRSTVALPR